jgi:P4 family phage/plasmid primase-like protien
MSPGVRDTAMAWRAAGTNVTPVAANGSKRPAGQWKHLQQTMLTTEQVAAMMTGAEGLGVICGAVSGRLEMLEFEGRAAGERLIDRFVTALADRGLSGLWQRILDGYAEQTPSGGVHVFCRLADGAVPGNTKLACRPATDDELAANPADKIKVLIETRGEGGFAVVAPSNGRTHPTGLPWVQLRGGPGSVATITMAEHEQLWEVARSFDAMPVRAPSSPVAASGGQPVQPGGNAAYASWESILAPHGWVYAGDDAKGDQLWSRPGKDGGTSATTHPNGGLWVFSSSTEFETGTAYSKAAVSAVLNDGLDASAALAIYGGPVSARNAAEDADYAAVGMTVADLIAPAADQQGAEGEGQQDAEGEGQPSPGHPFTDEAAANAWAKQREPWEFVAKHEGLKALELGEAVATMGPIAAGIDGRMWAYRHGAYEPSPDVVKARVVRLMKDSYRPSYASTVTDVVKTAAPVITSEPVERYLNVPNGLLDWRSGQLYAHTPDVLSTIQLGAQWQPGALCPAFDQWLSQVVPPDCVELAWELIGYLCYSGNPLHAAVMLVGDGRNGKGTYLRVVKAILGERNVTAASLADLVGTRFTTATLFGKIANIAGDIDGTYLENTAVLKAVTGGDMISAEHKGRDRFDFVPWAVPVFSANRIPASADTTAGYLSRWLILPFPNSFAGREDRTLDAKLHAELPGILASAIRRLPTLLARGQFGLGDSAREAKADFERRVDQVKFWVHTCCERGDYPLMRQAYYHQCYKNWVARDGGKPLRAAEFYDRLAAAGVTRGAQNGVHGFRGLRVIDECPGAADFGCYQGDLRK